MPPRLWLMGGRKLPPGLDQHPLHPHHQHHHLLANTPKQVAAGSMIVQKRHLIGYKFFTKTKKDYEEYRKRYKEEHKLRWDKDPKGPKNAVSWLIHIRNHDDPELWTMDKDYGGSPRLGDPIIESEYFYRDVPPPSGHSLFLDRVFAKAISSTFWFWFLYNLYWNSSFLFGHFYLPSYYEFSDEELGVPPDDEPDPEYWGSHYKPYRAYR